MFSYRLFVKTFVSILYWQETCKPINQNIYNAFLQVLCHNVRLYTLLAGNLQAYQPEYIQCFPTGSLSKRSSLYFIGRKPASLSTRIYTMLSYRFFVKTFVSILYWQETCKPINQNIYNAFLQVLCQNVRLYTLLAGNLQAYQPEYMQCFPTGSLSKRSSLYFIGRKPASLSTRICTMLSYRSFVKTFVSILSWQETANKNQK